MPRRQRQPDLWSSADDRDIVDPVRVRKLDDADATPDGGLDNEIRDIAMGAHQPLQFDTRYAKQSALAGGSSLGQRSLGVEEIHLTGESEPLMVGDNLGPAIRGRERDLDLSIEHDEDIHLPLSKHEQRDVRREGLLLAVGRMRSTISSVSLGKASSGRKSGTFHALEWLFL
jgi:hypothetical protein